MSKFHKLVSRKGKIFIAEFTIIHTLKGAKYHVAIREGFRISSYFLMIEQSGDWAIFDTVGSVPNWILLLQNTLSGIINVELKKKACQVEIPLVHLN
ncbi:MAG: hypothetical protein ACJ75B_09985 [Flavisolibacter sp.]